MNLVDKAKAKAEAEVKAEKDKKESEDRFYESLRKEIAAMVKLTLKGLKQFHNVETPRGTLKLLTGQKAAKERGFETYRDEERIAVLKLDRSKFGMTDANLLWVEGKIVSGTFDASDDCRDIPYTDGTVWIFNDWKWDGQEYRTDSARLGRFSESSTSTENVEKMLQKVADHLAPLFK